MIQPAWDEYRAWAARARELQGTSKKWTAAAVASAAGAALFGAAATQFSDNEIGKAFSLLAAIAAGLTPILGREILALGTEPKWIRARATAEAIKSECFRYGARAGLYAGADAEDKFIERRSALTADAGKAGLTAKPDPVGNTGDTRRPPDSMDLSWYLTHRIDEQITYYSDRQIKHEAAVKRLRLFVFGASVAAAVFGVAGLASQRIFAPWIGALTTIATALTAYVLLDRQEYLAASFAATAAGLARIKERSGRLPLGELVTQVEDLMQGEHAAWAERMTQTIPVPKIKKDDAKPDA